jgi:hypothetical protein
MDHLFWGDEDSSKVDAWIRIAVKIAGSFSPDLKKKIDDKSCL